MRLRGVVGAPAVLCDAPIMRDFLVLLAEPQRRCQRQAWCPGQVPRPKHLLRLRNASESGIVRDGGVRLCFPVAPPRLTGRRLALLM